MPDRLAEIAYRLSVGIVTLRDTDHLLRYAKAAKAVIIAMAVDPESVYGLHKAWQRIVEEE